MPSLHDPEPNDESTAASKEVGVNLLRSLFTTAELAFLQSVRRKDRRHPFQRLFFPQERDTKVVNNTTLALSLIFARDQGWIARKKRQLPLIESFEAASSLLGEIRAYGSLLSARLETRPGRTGQESQPDFLVENLVFVEVHTKQSEPGEAYALERFNQGSQSQAKGVSARLHPNSPFGAPRRDASVTRIAIQKLAQIKQKEEEKKKQFSNLSPSILWLDFQDETWNLIIGADAAEPVTLWNDEYTSGPLWYAFYGWKGAPVFEGQTKAQRPRRVADRMAHDGRFRRKTIIDAVIVSFPSYTIILENPFSHKPVPPSFFEKIALLPNFNPDYSFVNSPDPNLRERIASQKASLEGLANECCLWG